MSSHESEEVCSTGTGSPKQKSKSTKKALLEQQRKEKLAIKRARRKARRIASR